MNRFRISGLVLLFLVSGVALVQTVGQAGADAVSKDVYYRTDGVISGPPAPQLSRDDYPTLNLPSVFGESRLWIWFLAQQHLYFGGFVLGALFLVLAFELGGLVVWGREIARRCDRLARQTFKLILLVYSLTAFLGGIFLFVLLALYPGLMSYLGSLFHASFVIYGMVFFVLSGLVYFYYYTWNTMSRGFLKWLHATVGVLLNVFGITLMMLANSWAAFMMSPSGVDAKGRFLGNQWHVIHTALWNPMNVHRFFSNLVLSAAVMAAYASYRALTAANQKDRADYEWMSHAMFLALIGALFTLPFGGYWLLREIYGYRQQMGITLLGGLLAWLNILVVLLMGLLFLAINYYLWQRIDSGHDAVRYRPHVKYVFFVLIVSVIVYVTPHTLVITPDELVAMGGQQHRVVGNYGVESAKQPAVNIMMLVTGWSLLVMLRNRYKIDARRYTASDAGMNGLFLASAANLIWLGIYGYYIPANIRVGLSVPMVMSTLSALVIGAALTFRRTRGLAPMSLSSWGYLSVRGHMALFFIAVTVSWLMGLGGYMRSAVRLFWHVMEIFRDTSPWAFTHTIGFAGNMITLNVLCFWGMLLPVFWLAKFTERSTP